ncbi:MAG TPA: hypothetical protein DDX92_08420 [Flavobacteriales bacterium]|jgi:gliding motility-associated-like protein|nr:hypothetical protein [Flavobacteriales bacterium]
MSKPKKIEEVFKSLKNFESDVDPSLWQGIKTNIQPTSGAVSSGSAGSWISGLSSSKLILGLGTIAIFSLGAFFVFNTSENAVDSTQEKPEITGNSVVESAGGRPEKEIDNSKKTGQRSADEEKTNIEKNSSNTRQQDKISSGTERNQNHSFSERKEEPVVQRPLPKSETRIDNRKALTQTFQLGERTFAEVPVSRVNAFPIGGPAPLEVKFTSEGQFNDILWSFGDGDVVEDLENPEHTFSEPGLYEVTITGNLANGLYMSEKVFIEVRPGKKVSESSALNVPNVFTPNGDGEYDEFFVQSKGIQKFTISIYNRGGQMVYQSNSFQFSWDGRDQNGQPVPSGTYYYMISATGIDGKLYAPKGSLTVLR